MVRSSPTYEGETTYGGDPGTKQVVFRDLTNQGRFLNGTVGVQGDALIMLSHDPDANGRETQLRTAWVRTESNA